MADFSIGNYKILSNKSLAPCVFEMIIEGETGNIKRSGQFINIKIAGLYLRRPISICDFDDKTITIIFKVVGKGTEILSQYKKGDVINCMVGLGNGYDYTKIKGKNVLLVGGGLGLPPLYKVAKDLKIKDFNVTTVMGFSNADQIYYYDKFKELNKTVVTTIDGSEGIKGLVTDGFDEKDFDYYFCCGPEPMLNAMLKLNINGQLSYEARMGCGFGVCMGCTCKTKWAYKRICIDGPVMTDDEMK